MASLKKIRMIKADYEKNGDRPKAQAKCPLGHGFSEDQSRDSAECDGCMKALSSGSTLFKCVPCNLNLCVKCHDNLTDADNKQHEELIEAMKTLEPPKVSPEVEKLCDHYDIEAKVMRWLD